MILDTLYREFIDFVYTQHPTLDEQPSGEQLRVIYDYGFARADYLVRNLQKLGHDATQVLLNVPQVQRRIAGELHLPTPRDAASWKGKATRVWRGARRKLAGASPLSRPERDLLYAQIQNFRPDVILNTAVLHVHGSVFRPWKAAGVRVIGECAYPIPPRMSLSDYDAMLSALPSYSDRFRAEGVRTLDWPHAFEDSALERIGDQETTDDVVFIGMVSRQHVRRRQLLEALAERVPLRIFGPTPHGLPRSSPLKGKFQPPLWGYDMLRALARAKVALNIHAELAGAYAANVRLFETTGAGTLLLTDFKENLPEFFRIGEEIVAFHDSADCAAKIDFYLANDDERRRVAHAGQARTLTAHTYRQRVAALLAFLQEN